MIWALEDTMTDQHGIPYNSTRAFEVARGKVAPPRFYKRYAGEGTNSWNVYDRETPKAGNRTGHACIAPMVSAHEARKIVRERNGITR